MANIEFTQGEDVSIGLTITDSDGTPIDISSDTFDAKIKNVLAIDTPLADFAFSIIDGPAGKMAFTLTDVQTLDILPTVEFNAKGVATSTPLAVLRYDMFRTDAATGLKRKLVDGLVTVNPCMTYDGV